MILMFAYRKPVPPLEQFHNRFDSELSCARHLYQMKWPDGFVCPRCAWRYASTIETRRLPLFQCGRCRHQTSLLTGTVMEGSRTTLLRWYMAMFLLARPGVGITAVALSKAIRVTYKTAWLMLHKIRHAISQADASVRLSGTVRINYDVYGRPDWYYITQRYPKEQPLFTGGTVTDQGDAVYVKMKLVPAEHMRNLYILPSAEAAFTNGHADAEHGDALFFPKRNRPKRFPSLSRCYRSARSWIRHSFKGIGRKYVQNYLDEFCFCLNQDLSGISPFHRLPQVCALHGTVTQAALRSRPAV
jgi:transposase-like protein